MKDGASSGVLLECSSSWVLEFLTKPHWHQHVQERARNLYDPWAHLIDEIEVNFIVSQIPQRRHEKFGIKRNREFAALIHDRQGFLGLTDVRRVGHDVDVALREGEFDGV